MASRDRERGREETRSGREGRADSRHRTYDYSRFSNGPRRVPTPRGSSLRRAEALGLGTEECARRLLHGGPLPEWIAAADAEAPERILWPIDEGRWVRGFGYVRRTRPDLIHRGVDIAAPTGTMVRAAADGIVAYADNGVRGYGNLIMIVHANGWMTLYAHASRITVQPGYRVQRGERIGLVGQTGIARGPHLHFELWQRGRAVSPTMFFDGGPAFVQRVARRAASRGLVPEPQEPSGADRIAEGPLPPHPLDQERAPSVASTGTEPTPREFEEPNLEDLHEPHENETESIARLPEHEIGSRELADFLLENAPNAAMLEAIAAPVYNTLLFPLTSGEVRTQRGRTTFQAEPATAVRAPADGVVVFAGELPRRGQSILLLHRNGWVTGFFGLGEVAVEPGALVERRSWVGRVGEAPLEMVLRVAGVAQDPTSYFVAAN